MTTAFHKLLLVLLLVSSVNCFCQDREVPYLILKASVEKEDFEPGTKFRVLVGDSVIGEVVQPSNKKTAEIKLPVGKCYKIVCAVPGKNEQFILVKLDSNITGKFASKPATVKFSPYDTDDLYEQENTLFGKNPLKILYYNPAAKNMEIDPVYAGFVRNRMNGISDLKREKTVLVVFDSAATGFSVTNDYPWQADVVMSFLVYDYLNSTLIRDFTLNVTTDGSTPQQFNETDKIAFLLGMECGHRYQFTLSAKGYADITLSFDFRNARTKEQFSQNGFIVMVEKSPENKELIEKITTQPLYIGNTAKNGKPWIDLNHTDQILKELEALATSGSPFHLD